MDEFNKMLKNQTVNSFATAFIFAAGTVSFFSGVANMIFGDLLDSGAVWAWKTFWTELVVYLVLICVAWWVHSMAKSSS
ncbi:MAG: hypothetical protein UX30_C0003G0074 [Candidatus Saccharibacteria bacterium GW2011_GWA2_46_10]|nr:MAG: hypothetical protein UX30_C0003G0074 [Candidatus Saccharibacteria bacterium GW2011_GWA2_46_10]OGL34374.1 MAG: hypothetical protein A3F05_02380 [Candidatus Saccharibacteria bacterium RIFCSPHIGHO2_12_FULL_47_17]